MKIIIGENTESKLSGLLQTKIGEILDDIKQRYRNEEISASNWYLTLFSHIDKVKVINIKYKPSLSVYIDVYADAYFDEDDVQGFAQYLREKLYYAGNPWMVPILINGKLEDGIITEDGQKKTLQDKLNNSIDRLGLLSTIKMMGGYSTFVKLFPEFFKKRLNKIDLIRDLIAYDVEAEGRIYLGEIGNDILINRIGSENGGTLEDFADYVQRDCVGVTVWEFDDEGQMYDEYYDIYEIPFEDVTVSLLNDIFDVMVKFYLK
jgi:hypothetical protein